MILISVSGMLYRMKRNGMGLLSATLLGRKVRSPPAQKLLCVQQALFHSRGAVIFPRSQDPLPLSLREKDGDGHHRYGGDEDRTLRLSWGQNDKKNQLSKRTLRHRFERIYEHCARRSAHPGGGDAHQSRNLPCLSRFEPRQHSVERNDHRSLCV